LYTITPPVFLVDFVHTYHLNNIVPEALLLFIRL